MNDKQYLGVGLLILAIGLTILDALQLGIDIPMDLVTFALYPTSLYFIGIS